MNKQELASKIWAVANTLRRKIKASEYKDYILGLMFYKYLSDKELEFIAKQGGTREDINDPENIDYFKRSIGYYIREENLFDSWKRLDLNLGAKDVHDSIEAFNNNVNENYGNVFEGVFNTLEAGLTKLGANSGSRDKAVRDLVDLVADIPATSKDYDVMGYIYEYLLSKFSTEAKRDGAFFTPHEVTHLMSRIIADRMKDRKELSIYDPCLGSGGLLLNVGTEAGRYIDPDKITYYGQELITETYNLARENLVMRGINSQNICVRNGDTLDEDWPYFDAETPYKPLFVDAATANPPYSMHWDSAVRQNDPRFDGYGYAPDGKADYAFLLHCLYHIKGDGIMTIVLPHGVLFRGDSEGEIRKALVNNHNIETVIGLPAGIFASTPIATLILVLSKGRKSDDILFIDASQNYVKDGTINKLQEKDVQKIFDVVRERKTVENFSRLVPMKEIVANDYNLNIPRYVSAKVQDDPYDLYSVMTGELSEGELARFDHIWQAFPMLKEKLMALDDGYAAVKDVDIKAVVEDDGDVHDFLVKFGLDSDLFAFDQMADILLDGKYSKETEHEIKAKLFERFKNTPLVDSYDVYQEFASRWDLIASDKELVAANGIGVCRQIEPNMVTKKVKDVIAEEQKGWKGTIFDFNLIKKTYFTDDYKAMEELEGKAADANAKYMELYEELDEDAKTEISKDGAEEIDAKKLRVSIKVMAGGAALKILKKIEKLMTEEREYRKEILAIEKALDDKAKTKIENLTDDEIRDLLRKKWIEPVRDGIRNVGKGVVTTFVKDLQTMQKKYADPISEIDEKVGDASKDLREMLDQLTGNGKDMAAIKILKEALI